MIRNIYALLVGIDNYPSPVPTLKGCANDIEAIETYLSKHIDTDKYQLRLKKLIDKEATRQAVIEGFEKHLCQADSDDIALFYYSGHGGQEKAPEEFWHLEPDHLDETLVCYDSRTSGSYDLADKELRYLWAQVAQKNPRIIVILDCCHSGSGTRNIPQGVRLAPEDTRDRPLDSFIFAKDSTFKNLLFTSSKIEKKKTGLDLPQGNHILLAACRDYQYAKEGRGDKGEPRGVFSHFFLKTLEQSNGKLSYQDIVRNIEALVNGTVKDQAPQIEATHAEHLQESFLAGAIPERPFSYILRYSTISDDEGWEINGGVINGIPKPSSADETTYLSIFPLASTSEQLKQPPLGEVKVTKVFTEKSKVEITNSLKELNKNQSYWAFVTSLPIKRLKVYIKGNLEADVELAKKALVEANIQKSLYVATVEKFEEADYNLQVRNGQYWITQRDNDLPVVAPIPEQPNPNIYTKNDAEKTIKALEAIARWNHILKLKSQGSKIDPNKVEMEIILVGHGNDEDDFKPYEPNPSDNPLTQDSELRLEYIYDQGKWKRPVIEVKLTNNTDENLYCNILFLSEDYSVTRYGGQTYVLRVEGGEINRTRKTDMDTLIIPPEFLKNGITEYKDIFKLIVSTTDFNADLLQQKGLQPPPPSRNVPRGSLESLLQQIDTRNSGGFGKKYDDWITKEVTVTIVKPRAAEQLQPGKGAKLLNDLVEVQPHPSFQAKVTLTTVSQTTRDIGNLIAPPILWDEQGVIESFKFTTTRGSDPGLSAVELFDVKGGNLVTKDAPLTLLVKQTLEEDEYLLPYSHDGEFFLPLGRGVKNGELTEITLERLPQPTTSSRSLGGSIKIFFKKLRSQKLGHSYDYPILTTAEVREENNQIKVSYNPELSKPNLEAVKKRVDSAQKILLYIHGIIGDTETMVGSVQQAKLEVNGQLRPLRELYDLVLTFDYENLHTTIEENAKFLRQRLEAVGLGANHGKELHIVAHSMGGLVSRWFIEREGGNQMVQHLVMLGTPNTGSPWPAVQDMAFVLLAWGLNKIPEMAWPAKVVADLAAKALKFTEANDNALDQMQPDSPFFKEIANNPDPQVRYTIIAGNRSLPQLQSQDLLRRLTAKLFTPVINQVVDGLVFGGELNDIAVHLASIKSVRSDRTPQPKVLPDAACDHLTYFTTEAGLKALADALHP